MIVDVTTSTEQVCKLTQVIGKTVCKIEPYTIGNNIFPSFFFIINIFPQVLRVLSKLKKSPENRESTGRLCVDDVNQS